MATVTVRINGMDYKLKGKEDEAYLKSIASHVEDKLQEILTKNTKLSVSAASVLTAINLADESFKAKKELNDILNNYENLEIVSKSLKQELEDVKIEYNDIITSKDAKNSKLIEGIKAELKKSIEAKKIIELEKKELEKAKTVLLSQKSSLEIERAKLRTLLKKDNSEPLKEEIKKLKEQLSVMESEKQGLISTNKRLKDSHKEMKFEMQSCKYRMIDLENKLVESQITVAKERAKKSPVLAKANNNNSKKNNKRAQKDK